MSQLDNEFTFLVLLTRFESMFVFPSKSRLATLAVDVSNSVQSSEQHALLGRSATNVDHRVEEVCSTLTSLKRLGDEFVVIGQMSATVDAGVSAVAIGQISLESFENHFSTTLIATDSIA